MDGSDLWYYSSSNERWRMVATYRGSDGDPKERFVHHQAGASGDGGSSYIDLVALREKDVDEAWTDASDGDLEERLYYCQNQHADVVALITAAGAQREMARYSAYGVPFGLPIGDTNSDGDCDQADQNQVRDWALATPAVYDVRGDLDLDGDVDLTDRDTLRDNYKGVTLGRGVLSAPLVRNQRGVAGYIAAGYEPSTYLIRHRVFPSELGRWITVDPLVASGLLHDEFEYADSAPHCRRDAFGLVAEGACMPIPKDENGSSVRSTAKWKSRKTNKTLKIAFKATAKCSEAIGNGECSSSATGSCAWKCNVKFRTIYQVEGQSGWTELQQGQTEYGEVFMAVHDAEVDSDGKPPVLDAADMHYPVWSGPGGYTGHFSAHNVDISVTSDCPGFSVQTWTAKTKGSGTMKSSMYFLCGCERASKNDSDREKRVVVPREPN